MPNRLLLALSERDSIRRLVGRGRFTRSVVERFVAGDSIDDAMRAAASLAERGITSILDYLGEDVTNSEQADAAASFYDDLLARIHLDGSDAHISVKLTQLGLDLSFEACLQRMRGICSRASESGTIVAMDMESRQHTERTIETFRTLTDSYENVVLCLQAYLRRTEVDVASLLPLRPAIRICKGAYNEPRQIAYGRRDTREAFERIMVTLMRSCPYTAVATHDGNLIEAAKKLAQTEGIPVANFEFQMLFGVRRELQQQLVDEGYSVRVYIPFGDQWYPYLMRRIAERPANLRFLLEALTRG